MSDQRFNTGNPIGSDSPLDRSDNTRNFDERMNSKEPVGFDRFGNQQLNWAGIASAGTGDTGIAVDAAARAVAAAGEVDQRAEQIVQDASSRAESAAGRAEAAEAIVDAANIEAEVARAELAASAAFVNADVYETVAAGRSAVGDGEQFQVISPLYPNEVVRYRRDSSSTQTELVRYPRAGWGLANAWVFTVLDGAIKVNSSAKIITFPSSCVVVSGARKLVTSGIRELNYSGAQSPVAYLYYNSENGNFGFSETSDALPANSAFFAVVRTATGRMVGNIPSYDLDGVRVGPGERDLPITGIYFGERSSVTVDNLNKIITFSGNVRVVVATGGTFLIPNQVVSYGTGVRLYIAADARTGAISLLTPGELSTSAASSSSVILGQLDQSAGVIYGMFLDGSNDDGGGSEVDGADILDGSISAAKLDFVEYSRNLFNPEDVTMGSVISADGTVTDNANYGFTGYIPVTPSSVYTVASAVGIRAFNDIAYYDSNLQFISRVSIRNDSEPDGYLGITTPANAQAARLNINVAGSGWPSAGERMFYTGSDKIPYERWHLPRFVGMENTAPDEAEIQRIVDEYISSLPDTGSYVTDSYNLFDPEAATLGYSISASGVLEENTAYAASDFIPVSGGDEYLISSTVGIRAFVYAAYFDASYQFITRDTVRNDTGWSIIVAPASAAYVRLLINTQASGLPGENNRMFAKSSVPLEYTPYGKEFGGVRLANDVLGQIGEDVRLVRKDNIMFTHGIDFDFTTDLPFSGYSDFNSSTSAQLYQMYDDLMAEYPSYITKQPLSEDSWGNPIALYRFRAPQPNAGTPAVMPKVFLVTGVHGMEHVAALTAYLMFEQMCDNWASDPLLEVLRFDVEFIIIPVVNPSGFDKFTRKNDNGVDINRNFPIGFGWQSTDPASQYYGGPSPLSEIESQNIIQVFNENPDIDAMYDFHNFNGTGPDTHPHIIWVATHTGDARYINHMTRKLVRRLTNHWREKFPWIPRDESWFAGYASSTVEGATIAEYAHYDRGIQFTSVFEVGGRWWIDPDGAPYDANHLPSCVETLTNWILINLSEIERR